MNAKDWKRLHCDPSAKGQRWYCTVCHTRYKTTFGILCELWFARDAGTNIANYVLAEFPPWELQDAKAMMIERNFADATRTAEDLLAALPRTTPMDQGAFMQPVGTEAGAYKFDYDALGTERL